MAESKSSSSIEQYADKDDQISQPLTKNAHRNPDIHQRGDTLPESLLEYQEGSGTLNPDVAGNTPVMMRKYEEVLGNGLNQNLIGGSTQLGTLSLVCTCPPQATGTPFIIASYAIGFYATPTGGGVDSYGWISIEKNGILEPGTRVYRWRQDPAPGTDIVPATVRRRIPINPGQTFTLRVVGEQLTPGGFDMQYAGSMPSDRCFFSTELYY